jgi:hypothetical protein
MTVLTGMTTWERWKAGLPARDRDDRRRFAEYDAALAADKAGPPPRRCPYDSCHHTHPELSGEPS